MYVEACDNLSATEVLNLLINSGQMLEEERDLVVSVKLTHGNANNAFYRVIADPYQDGERYTFDTIRVWYDDGVMRADYKG